MSDKPPQPTPPTGAKSIQRLRTTKPSTPGEGNSIPPPSHGGPSGGMPKIKKEFKPNVPTVRKKNENNNTSSGQISDLINSSLTPLNVGERPKVTPSTSKVRPAFNPNRKKPATIPIANMFSTPLVQADIEQSSSSYEINKKKEKKDSEFLAQLFHEMEVDPMQPFHPTHLPLVDPRKVMKAYSLDDASKDLNERKKELEMKMANGELSDTSNFDINAQNLVGTGGDINKKKESNHIKARPFYIDDQFLDKDKLFFIQLPNSLPSTKTRPNFNIPLPLPPTISTQQPSSSIPSQQSSPTNNVDNNNDNNEKNKDKENGTTENKPILDNDSFIPMVYPGDFPNTLKSLPSGQLGTLRIYKSGKTILKLGPVEYDISAGDKIKFLEEVNCFSKDGPTCYTLGTPSQHLVASPIISDKLI